MPPRPRLALGSASPRPALVLVLSLRRCASTSAPASSPRSAGSSSSSSSPSAPPSRSPADASTPAARPPPARPPIEPTTVALGTAFEQYALALLNTNLHMLLRRVGGRGDGGVDLRGEWWLPKPTAFRTGVSSASSSPPSSASSTPSSPSTSSSAGSASSTTSSTSDSDPTGRIPGESSGQPAFGAIELPPAADGPRVDAPCLTVKGLPNTRKLRPATVWAQCKAEARALGPRVVRELDGVLSGRDARDTLGVLVSKSGFSRHALLAALQARSALMLVHLPFDYHAASSSPSSSPSLSTSSPFTSASPEPAAEPPEEPAAGPIEVLGATYNPPFARFLAAHRLALRRELLGTTPTLGVFYAGARMGRYGPPVASLRPPPPPPLRPRGRPRKTPAEAKRKPGRPRKTPQEPEDPPQEPEDAPQEPEDAPQEPEDAPQEPEDAPQEPEDPEAGVRGPGRPQKAEGRRAGRPRKTVVQL